MILFADQWEILVYAGRDLSNRFQLVRNLANVLGSVQEELELAFEDELGLEGYGACLPMFDVRY